MIKNLLNKLVGVTDIKQSIAWVGTVGIAIGISAAIYIRLGQYIGVENERFAVETREIERLKAMIEPWNVPRGSGQIIYPADVREEVRVVQQQLAEITADYQRRLNEIYARLDAEELPPP